MFDVQSDPRRDLVRFRLSGFFTTADVDAFDRARMPHYARLRCAPNQHLTLCDASGMRIQTQEVVAAFARVVGDPRFTSRRMALIVGTSLSRLQAQRISDRDGVRLFRDAAQAEEWLLAPSAPPDAGSAPTE